MRFLVDVQLPPALARWLRERGHQADHIRDLGLDTQPDRSIAVLAANLGAAIVTKDVDFAQLSRLVPNCQVVWIRFGNATSSDLLRLLDPVIGEIEQALAEGQNLIEVAR